MTERPKQGASDLDNEEGGSGKGRGSNEYRFYK
jgi:hypothetical protein